MVGDMDRPRIEGQRPDDSLLGEFQTEIGRAFFSLPESEGFYLAGGAALIAQNAVQRTTKDLDAFSATANIRQAAAALEKEAARRGWRTERYRDEETFVRLIIGNDSEEVMVELCRDNEPLRPLHTTFIGPVLDLEDSAGNKMLALFGRAAPRDFSDVYELSRRYNREQLLCFAAERDLGFDRDVFRQMLRFLHRIDDSAIPIDDQEVLSLRVYFANWEHELFSQAFATNTTRDADHSTIQPTSSARPKPDFTHKPGAWYRDTQGPGVDY